jgi:hypothetical protein
MTNIVDSRFRDLAFKKLSDPKTGLSEGDRDFDTFHSLKMWFESKGFLTPKQMELLNKIFERN